jgi:hypothetical protein
LGTPGLTQQTILLDHKSASTYFRFEGQKVNFIRAVLHSQLPSFLHLELKIYCSIKIYGKKIILTLYEDNKFLSRQMLQVKKTWQNAKVEISGFRLLKSSLKINQVLFNCKWKKTQDFCSSSKKTTCFTLH